MSGTVPAPIYTPATFLAMFGEFSQAPLSAIQGWMTIAVASLNAQRWGNLYELGLYLFTAHNLSLGAEAARAAARGAAPGSNAGLISSKSAASLSVSFDTSSTTLQGAGDFNQTLYGVRFWRMALMVGTGGVEVSPDLIERPYNGPAWPGPVTGIVYNGR